VKKWIQCTVELGANGEAVGVAYFYSVFGKVTNGLEVIDKIEGVGSQNGATSKRVVIKDCGEL